MIATNIQENLSTAQRMIAVAMYTIDRLNNKYSSGDEPMELEIAGLNFLISEARKKIEIEV